MTSSTRIFRLTLFSYLILMFGIASASELSDDAAEAIRDLTNRWIEVSADGDIDSYLAIVTDDFIWLGSNTGPGYVGRKAVREFLEPYFGAFDFSMEDVTSEEVVVSADGQFAVHQWSGTAIVSAKDGSSISKYPRKYYDFWRRDTDGSWKCSRHLFIRID